MIVLASRSPRRRELLRQIGVEFRTVDIDVPEVRRPGETPEQYVRRVARDKATAGVRATGAEVPVLAADTEVIIDDDVLGKPADADDARTMLLRLSGRAHEVLSVVALAWDGRLEDRVSRSEVWFRELEPGEIAAYWASGEPADKAGGYAVQGRGAVFVRRLNGSHSGVMGLPLFETAELLREAGIGRLRKPPQGC